MNSGSGDNKSVVARLKRIEGQVRGVLNMLEEGRAHEELLAQLSAIKSAINGAAREIINEHLSNCVIDGIKCGNETATIDGLMTALDSFFKMK